MSTIAPEEIQDSQSGKVIALEGDTNVISTQLRLLPPSQKFLILPSLLAHLAPDSEKDAFDARAFIRDLQTAITQRTETARSFLQSSTPTQPRLVFAVHGSVSARTTCITKICQNITNGDIGEAESVFNELVKDGIAALAEPEKVVEEAGDQAESDTDGGDEDDKGQEEAIDVSGEIPQDAVDSQKRDTANSTHGGSTVERMPAVPISPKSRVMDLVRGMEQPKKAGGRYDSKIPISKFASSTSQPNDQIVRTVLTVPNRKTILVEKRTTFGSNQGASHLNRRTGVLSHQVEEDTDTDDDVYDPNIVSPGQDSVLSVPQTPGGVEYGEACLVDVPSSSPKKSVKRAKSAGKLYSSNARFQYFSSHAHHLKQTKSHYHLRDRPPPSAARNESEQDSSRFPTLPRTTFVKASETTIGKSPTSSRSSRSSNSSTSSTKTTNRAVYVERGTDALQTPIEESNDVPFVPVFELVEDLVIHFTDDQPNEIFESVVRSYKNGNYPIIPPTPDIPTSSKSPSSPSSLVIQEEHEPPISPRSISSMQLEVGPEVRPTSYLAAETDDKRYQRRSFDPYSDESYPPDIRRQWPPTGHMRIAESTVESFKPPTAPTEDVPPLPTEAEESSMENRFVDFSPVNPGSAISVQNSFRELLSILFPVSENYTQYLYPVAPEANRLWKPVFRNEEGGSIGIEGRTVDQIIAFGCDEGVKKDFFYQISGQIEKIGTKRDGFNRSGKLDIRYLTSNVMQSYINSSVTQQAPSPISNPHVLASLLVPHIEAFLATNTSTRLLILHYTSSDLPTVFALRNLLGKDLFKIAGILDSLASDPPSISRPGTSMSSRPRSPTPTNALESISTQKQSRQSLHKDSMNTLRRSSVTTSLKNNSQILKPAISFSKADYLLPSTATDTEIATFLSGMWKSLMEKSPFYTPEPEPKPIIIERPPLPPTPSSNGPRDRDSGYPPSYQTPRASKVSRLTGGAATGSTQGGNYAPSISSVTTKGNGGGYAASTTTTITNRHKYAASIASTKTTASERERKRGDKEWENFYIAEDDSEDDEYDKMILGRGMQRIVPEVKKVGQKANTKKALKWLGLA
ncbi:hypothetical protein BKA61DRAFT_294652 [Leptodontidium sp. MPI-SDFR-AT-0119]|nr:hypothetical protein BKA61DRAFT_294652 [Leptodontidium sp. MPI-SDFR-AT-0119]